MTGHLHPLTQITNQAVNYFSGYGFEVILGPEIETEENNFDRLNIPPLHPARAEHDTYYLKDAGGIGRLGGKLLRTHTSAMQVPIMATRRPPVRLLFPGRVFRSEATDSTHNDVFYQLEGLVIDREVSLRHLIGTLENWLKTILGNPLEIRVRPGYFPFVEPGIEVDLRRPGQSWLEMLGAGMVHPQVMRNMNLDPSEYQGFAFGCGLERLITIRTGLDDVRLLLANDYRLLGQF